MFSIPAVAASFDHGVVNDTTSPQTEALLSRLPDLPRSAAAALEVLVAAHGVQPHPLGPAATEAARRWGNPRLEAHDSAFLRCTLELLGNLLLPRRVPLTAALDAAFLAGPLLHCMAARHADPALRRLVVRALQAMVLCLAPDGPAVVPLLSMAEGLGAEVVAGLRASFDGLDFRTQEGLEAATEWIADLLVVMQGLVLVPAVAPAVVSYSLQAGGSPAAGEGGGGGLAALRELGYWVAAAWRRQSKLESAIAAASVGGRAEGVGGREW